MSEANALVGASSAASGGVLDSPRMQRGVLLIRLLIGSLYLATAALKVLTPVESAALAVTYQIPLLLTAAVVQAELALAALLLFGCWTKRTLVASAVLFAIRRIAAGQATNRAAVLDR